VKPNAEDASIGIGPDSVVRNRAALRRQAARLMKRYCQPVLIEDYIAGREFYVAIVEDTAGLRTLPISEIVFRGLPRTLPRIVGYDAKWKPACVWYRRTKLYARRGFRRGWPGAWIVWRSRPARHCASGVTRALIFAWTGGAGRSSWRSILTRMPRSTPAGSSR